MDRSDSEHTAFAPARGLGVLLYVHKIKLNKVDASRRAEKCRSLRVKVEVGVSGCA